MIFDETRLFLKTGIVGVEENIPNARQVKPSLRVKASLIKERLQSPDTPDTPDTACTGLVRVRDWCVYGTVT